MRIQARYENDDAIKLHSKVLQSRTRFIRFHDILSLLIGFVRGNHLNSVQIRLKSRINDKRWTAAIVTTRTTS